MTPPPNRVSILIIATCLKLVFADNDGLFFNAWPYNTGKKATNEKSEDWKDQKDVANPWLVESDWSKQQNTQQQVVQASAPASNNGGFQSSGSGQNTNFQMKTVNNNNQRGQNFGGFNNQQQQGRNQNGHQQQQFRGNGNQFNSGNRNSHNNNYNNNNNQRGRNQFGNGNNNYQGSGFQATTPTTSTTSATTTTTTRPPNKANQNDGKFFNSWPYNTNSNKKESKDTDNWKAKNEPNPFLMEAPKEYPPQRDNFGNNRNQPVNAFNNPQKQNILQNPIKQPFAWPDAPLPDTTTTTTERTYNIKTKWQYEEEEDERRRQKANAQRVPPDDDFNQWKPPPKKSNQVLEAYLNNNNIDSKRESLEKSGELEAVPANFYEGKLDKVDPNFRFMEPGDETRAKSFPKYSVLTSGRQDKEGTIFEDPPSKIQEDKYWYLPKSMKEFVGVQSSSTKTQSSYAFICLLSIIFLQLVLH